MSLPLLHSGKSAPGLSAALDLRFALDKSLTAYRGPTPSFSRASTGSYFDASGVLRYAALNLVQYSSDFSNVYWFAAGGSARTVNYSIDPEGKNTACRVTGNGYFQSGGITKSAGIYTLSLWVKSTSGGSSNIRIFIDGGSTTQTISVTGTWTRVSMTQTFASSNAAAVGIYPDSSDILVWGFQLESGTTVGTYAPTTANLNSAPRFNHTYNGTSWVSRGLLVEEQRTQRITYTDFSSAWTLSGSTGSASAGTSPDGTNNAYLIYPSSTGAFRSIYQAAGASNCVSIFAKASGMSWLCHMNIGGNAGAAWFNLSNGTVGTVASGYTASIANCGNGWYRCSVSHSSNFSYLQPSATDGDNTSTGTANGTNGILLYGPQTESGSFLTSFIPNLTSSSVTRSADVCQITGTDFSGFWNASEGTFAVDFDKIGVKNSASATSILFGTTNNNSTPYEVYYEDYNGSEYFRDFGGSSQFQINTGASTQANSTIKIAGCYKANDVAISKNGASVLTDTTVTLFGSQTTLTIGGINPGQALINGHIARLRYYPVRLPNATLQTLST